MSDKGRGICRLRELFILLTLIVYGLPSFRFIPPPIFPDILWAKGHQCDLLSGIFAQEKNKSSLKDELMGTQSQSCNQTFIHSHARR